MKKILVTGGFGFIGTHLVEELLRAHPASSIHIVDNLSTNPLPPGEFLEEIGSPPRLTYTITSIQEFLKQNPDEPFDEIYHLASVVGPAGVLPHAGKMIRSIVDDTYALIDAALRWNARLLDVSTSEVYGGGQSGYCSEEFPKIVPAKTTVRLEYAIGKLAAETALINTCRISDLHAVIVRPFNVAGPRQSGKGGFVLPRFIDQALRGEPLTVFGNGKQVRAFTHVKDIARGIRLVMEKGQTGEAYNIGNPMNRITILELAQRVIKLTNSKSPIAYVDPKTIYGPLYEEANDKFPDAGKAQKELGWQPERGVDAVICDAVEYVRQRSAASSRKSIVTWRSHKDVLVSICVPTYNRHKQLPATLETIFSQTLSDFELLICDDGSKDETPDLIDHIKDSRARVLRNEHNLGLPQTLNRLFSIASGKYVAIFHDHDLFHPRLLDRCVELLDRNPNAAFAFSGVTWIDEQERDIVTFIPFKEGEVDRQRLLHILLFKLACPIAMSGAVIRKSALNFVGYFDPRFGISADLDLWIRLTHRYNAVFAAEPLVRVRTRTRLEHQVNGGWKAIRRCCQIRLKGCNEVYAEQPLKRALSAVWVSSLHRWAEVRESLSLWTRGQRQQLLEWHQDRGSLSSGPYRMILPLLAWSSPLGKTVGNTRRRILRRA